MVKVKKRSGEMEEFDTSKLKSSLTKAGVDEGQATRIAETIAGGVTEGTETAQLLMRAATELRQIDSEAAKRYESYKSARVQS